MLRPLHMTVMRFTQEGMPVNSGAVWLVSVMAVPETIGYNVPVAAVIVPDEDTLPVNVDVPVTVILFPTVTLPELSSTRLLVDPDGWIALMTLIVLMAASY